VLRDSDTLTLAAKRGYLGIMIPNFGLECSDIVTKIGNKAVDFADGNQIAGVSVSKESSPLIPALEQQIRSLSTTK
jgi:hypothetical protein